MRVIRDHFGQRVCVANIDASFARVDGGVNEAYGQVCLLFLRSSFCSNNDYSCRCTALSFQELNDGFIQDLVDFGVHHDVESWWAFEIEALYAHFGLHAGC